MALAGVDHITIDALDAESPADPWPGVPAIVVVEKGIVAEVGGDLVVRESAARGSGGEVLADCLGELTATTRQGVHLGDAVGWHSPVYDLCLVRRRAADREFGEGLIVGEHVPIGEPRQHGIFKFPAYAVRLDGRLFQVHASDGMATVYDSAGSAVEDANVDWLADNRDRAIWLAVDTPEGIRAYDVLVFGHRQTACQRLADRLAQIPDAFAARQPLLDKPEDLAKLPKGQWLIRWAGDMADFPEPHWFVYAAQTVRPGQYLAPEMLARIAARNTFEASDLPDGIRCQVHVEGGQVWVYGEGCAFDRSEKVPHIISAVRDLPDGVVLDGVLASDTVSRRVLLSLWGSRKDLASAGTYFIATDCLHTAADGDLQDSPQADRIAMLQALSLDAAVLRVAEFAESPTAAVPAEDHRELSRRWVQSGEARVEQRDEPVRFVYRRQYEGAWSPDECSKALNRLLAGHSVEGVYNLRRDLDRVRETYRTAGWKDAPRIARAAIGPVATAHDVAALVRPLTVTGELWLEAPPDVAELLGIRHFVVGDGFQFLATPERVEDLGTDAFLSGEPSAKWAAQQTGDPELEKVDLFAIDSLRFDDGRASSALDCGSAILGVQKHDFHEAFLIFDGRQHLSGRYTWSLVERDEGLVWFGMYPQDQEPYLLKHDQATEVAKAAVDRGWIAWNPEGIRLLSDTRLAESLPLNWEERIEAFEDAPFVDFPA